MSEKSTSLVLASTQLSERLGVERGTMLDTIKAQCFKGVAPDRVSDAQLAAFVSVAQAIGVNPLLSGMLYAYPERNGGITPIIGPDGIFSMLATNPDIEGWSTKHETIDGEKTCTATIKHKRLGDITKMVFLSEWVIDNNPNWKTRPRHMLEIRALKQCARQVIHGIPFDEDDKTISEINVTRTSPGTEGAETTTSPNEAGQSTEQPKRQAPPRRGGARAAAAEGAIDTTATPANESSTATEKTTAETPAAGVSSPAAGKPVEQPPKTVANPEPQMPEVAPGVSLTSFHGAKWPMMLTFEVTKITLQVTRAKKPLARLTVKHEKFTGEVITYEHVQAVKEGESDVVKLTADWLKVGAVIDARVEPKAYPSKDDPSKPDLTRAPVLIATKVSEVVDEV